MLLSFMQTLQNLHWKEGQLQIGLSSRLQSKHASTTSFSYSSLRYKATHSPILLHVAFIKSSLVGWTSKNLHMNMPQLKTQQQNPNFIL
jgi:hypothetical protein